MNHDCCFSLRGMLSILSNSQILCVAEIVKQNMFHQSVLTMYISVKMFVLFSCLIYLLVTL